MRATRSDDLTAFLGVDRDRLSASLDYRRECFYRVFPATVHSPPNQSPTPRWIYSHTMDGRGVVTPRDVIDLLTKAKQQQQDEFQEDAIGETDTIIGSAAIRYGLTELSKRKRATVLRAELPHLWPHIEKFVGQRTEYSERAIRQLLGAGSAGVVPDLVNIGFLARTTTADGRNTYKIPFLYREGLELSQGRQD